MDVSAKGNWKIMGKTMLYCLFEFYGMKLWEPTIIQLQTIQILVILNEEAVMEKEKILLFHFMLKHTSDLGINC